LKHSSSSSSSLTQCSAAVLCPTMLCHHCRSAGWCVSVQQRMQCVAIKTHTHNMHQMMAADPMSTAAAGGASHSACSSAAPTMLLLLPQCRVVSARIANFATFTTTPHAGDNGSRPVEAQQQQQQQRCLYKQQHTLTAHQTLPATVHTRQAAHIGFYCSCATPAPHLPHGDELSWCHHTLTRYYKPTNTLIHCKSKNAPRAW
jgi:hypothetical protein